MYTSYREPLCELDNRGVPFFSPLCDPKAKSVTTEIRSYHQMVPQDMGCKIAPVTYPKAQVAQFDDSVSARDWFKDPTYGQRIQMRKRGLRDDVLDINPSLQEYHRIKTMEKIAGSTLQTL